MKKMHTMRLESEYAREAGEICCNPIDIGTKRIGERGPECLEISFSKDDQNQWQTQLTHASKQFARRFSTYKQQEQILQRLFKAKTN